MDVGARFRGLRLVVILVVVVAFLEAFVNIGAAEDGGYGYVFGGDNGGADGASGGSSIGGEYDKSACNENLGVFLPLPYNGLPNMVCKPIWNSYVLRYYQTEDNIVTIILSAIYTTGWVGIGFSKDGMMLNSSSMVGWITQKGTPVIKQYYAQGFTPNDVLPDKGELPLTSVPPYIAVFGARIYLAFQLKYSTPLTTQSVLLASSVKYPLHHHLAVHDDKTTVRFDFSAGKLEHESVGSANDNILQKKQAHGVLGLIGWGLILPYGAIVPRYLKHRDPLWYYLHVFFQFVGFILAVSTVIVGVSLYNRINAHVPTHRGIGIFVLVLACLQVLAFILRPDKDSKKRRYWNWYHQCVGWIALFLGALNIVLGIQIGDAGTSWKIGYGFLLSSVLLSCIVLEALKMRSSDKSNQPPAFQMNSVL